MFTHHGTLRTHVHNLKIATLLSFVAGFVNVTGFVSFQQLTTNVTGHFAFFVDDVYQLKFYHSIIFFVFVISFFLGAFVSNILVELIHKKSEKHKFIAPVILEISILLLVAFFGVQLMQSLPNILAIGLLFAMGIQNALVTKISNAVVRTTHLTGLFTDLGIETSQLFFRQSQEKRNKLKINIRLRIRIISFFFIGGILAGILFKHIQILSLIIPASLLTIGLIYDVFKFKLLPWNSSDKNEISEIQQIKELQ